MFILEVTQALPETQLEGTLESHLGFQVPTSVLEDLLGTLLSARCDKILDRNNPRRLVLMRLRKPVPQVVTIHPPPTDVKWILFTLKRSFEMVSVGDTLRTRHKNGGKRSHHALNLSP